MRKVILFLLISGCAFSQRNGLIDADTTKRPKSGLSALAFNNGSLRIVRSSGNSIGVGLLSGTQTWSGLNTFGGISSLSSGTANVFSLTPTINQSGTAGYRGIFVSPFEQTTGSGSKLLLDLGTNSAANGSGTHTSRFSVANDGSIISSYGGVFNTGDWFLGPSPVNAGFRLDVSGTTRVQGDLTSGGKLFFSTNTFFASNPSVGTISKQADHGLIFAGATGTTNDFAIGTVGGQLLLVNPTGTPAVALVPAVSGGNVLVGTSSQVPSAILTLQSSTRGFLPPRMTQTQRNAIASPATGLTLYCTDCTATDASTGVMQTYNGSTWKNNW